MLSIDEVKVREEKKALKNVLFLSILYIPTLILLFNYIYNRFIATNELTIFKYTLLVMMFAVAISFVLSLIQLIINRKFYVRDIKEFKMAFIFSYLVYTIIQLIVLRIQNYNIAENEFSIAIFNIVTGIIIYIIVTDYDVTKMGIYTDKLGDYVFYKIDRNFKFKLDLNNVNLTIDRDPIGALKGIVDSQTKTLPLADDLKNIGKYYHYIVKSYKKDNRIYSVVCFSNTGKRCDNILSVDVVYSEEMYATKLEELNNSVNIYLRHD